jgi:TM2 domain-containing membrane protein YozV
MAMIFCRARGAQISDEAPVCPRCGAPQRPGAMPPGMRPRKDKVAAGLLAIFLGGLGVHRFYLGDWWGIFYLLFCWTFIPGIVAFVEGIIFLTMNDQDWLAKYPPLPQPPYQPPYQQ